MAVLKEITAKKSKPFTMNRKKKKMLFYVAMVSLPLLQFFIFYICVNVNSILLAFQSIDMTVGANGRPVYTATWGFSTMSRVLKDLFGGGIPVKVWQNTLVRFAASMIISMPLSLFFSYYIFKKFPLSNLFKVILFLPAVVSGLVLIIMYRYFVVDVMPQLFPGMPDLLDESNPNSFYTIMFFSIIAGFGTSVLMYIGSMNNISESVLEYAKIDGASPWREFIHIVLPSVYPTFVTFVVVAFAQVFTNQMHLFDFYGNNAEMYMRTIGYYLYAGVQRAGSDITRYSYFSAMGFTLTCIAVPVTLLLRKAMTKFGPRVD